MQTAARDGRLIALVSEGAGRQPLDDQMQIPNVPEALRWLSPTTVKTVAGVILSNRTPPPGLAEVVPRIAPRPVLLISGGHGNGDEDLNAVYQCPGGPTFTRWEIPYAGHTGGLTLRHWSASSASRGSSMRRRSVTEPPAANCGS